MAVYLLLFHCWKSDHRSRSIGTTRGNHWSRGIGIRGESSTAMRG